MKMTDKLRNIRKAKGFSQEFIATKLGYKSFTTIQKWETGLADPPIGKLSQLAELYNVPITALLDDDNYNKELGFFEYPYYGYSFEFPLSSNNIINTIIFPDDIMGTYARSSNIFFIRLFDESLNKCIPKHTLLGIHTDFDKTKLKNESLVFFKYNERFYCYYYYSLPDSNKFIFKPNSNSPLYTDLVIDTTDPNLNIIGYVVIYTVFM